MGVPPFGSRDDAQRHVVGVNADDANRLAASKAVLHAVILASAFWLAVYIVYQVFS